VNNDGDFILGLVSKHTIYN